MARIALLISFSVIFCSCYREHYASNKFSGVYEIQGGSVETWTGGKLESREQISCNFTFYLYGPENVNFGNGKGYVDTGGAPPEFLMPLNLRFEYVEPFEWNLGPGDRVRLSFVRPDPNKPGDFASAVNVKRNAIGTVNAWTYVKPKSDGYYFYTYHVRKKKVKL